jgi:Sugar phosphate isomerases/epimerases
MKKSISAWAFDPKRPLSEVFALAKDHGFEAVEVAVAEEGELTPETSAEDCARIREQAEKAGVELAGLASGLGWKYPLTASDPEVRHKGIATTAGSLRVARALGVDALLLVPGGVAADFVSGFVRAPYDQAYENALMALRDLKAVAEETQVAIGVENVWNMFLLSPLETRDFLDQVGSAYVGSYFDVGNVILTGYPEQWIGILGKRIKRVHFKDFKRSVGTLAGFCDLLDGDVDWPAVMASLRRIGYNGYVTSEFFNCEADLPKISKAMDHILAL